jgi:iron(II)-dependent oxidoreductase
VKSLLEDLRDARRRSLALIEDLSEQRMREVPCLEIVNLPLWEYGHVAWFQEKWLLRRGGELPSVRPEADALYDSARIPHRARWSLPLPSLAETLDYLQRVLDEVGAREASLDPYFVRLATFHEDMHGEAVLYTRQTLRWPRPRAFGGPCIESAGPCPGDAEFRGGVFRLGAEPGADPFVFDNEKWAHPVIVEPFRLARAPVTQGEFAEFVDAGGYVRAEFWSEEGRAWRARVAAERPFHWERGADGRWWRWAFDRLVPVEEHRPMIHVSWHEAEAWCRWRGRRLPTEAEREFAASAGAAGLRRRFPWGDDPPTPSRAHLDGRLTECVDVGACAEGDGPGGCRQLVGNVWEWTASAFKPFPGFVPDPYKEYSAPWFGTHKVLRGGCFATRSRLLRNTWRNFFTPDRRDIFAGFRTAALPRP